MRTSAPSNWTNADCTTLSAVSPVASETTKIVSMPALLERAPALLCPQTIARLAGSLPSPGYTRL